MALPRLIPSEERPENINAMWHLVEHHFAEHLGGRAS
jgi:hypothetical protein